MTDSPARPNGPPVTVRRATPPDVTGVVTLIHAYADEVFEQSASVTPEALLRDGFGSVLEFLVAEKGGELIGFAAWEKTYDVIAGARGGVLLALYVRPESRGQGHGDRLLRAVANEARAVSATFLAGVGEDPYPLTAAATPRAHAQALAPQSSRHRAADITEHARLESD